jgi:hypothetical protein
VGPRAKKPPITKGLVATVGSLGVEGAERGEERKELELED